MMMLVNLYYPLRTPSKVRSLSSNYVSYIKKKKDYCYFLVFLPPAPPIPPMICLGGFYKQ